MSLPTSTSQPTSLPHSPTDAVTAARAIDSPTNPKVKQLVALRSRGERDSSGLFVAEGTRALERLLDAGRAINTVYVQSDLLDQQDRVVVERCAQGGVSVVELSPSAMAKASYRDRPEGVIAVAPQWADELDKTPLSSRPLVIVAEGVEKPGNLGAILRTADASGCDAVIVCDERVDRFNPNVIRAATAVVFSMPVISVSSADALRWTRQHGLTLVATTPDTDLLYWDADLDQPVAVLMGAEDTGLSQFWLDHADVRVRLPMAGQADSLNVGVATAVVLYEAVRQRTTPVR